MTVVLFSVFAGSAWAEHELTTAYAGVLVLANTAPLLLLARNPLAVVLTFAVTYPLWLDPIGDETVRQGHFLQSLPTLVALYACGAWARPLWLRAIALVVPAWMLGAAASGLWPTEFDDILYVGLVLVIVWGLGVVEGRRRVYAEQLEIRTRELQEARLALADQAVVDERARIARELHDVVAHAMSVITVQAGVGAHLMGTRPDRAADALAIIEGTGREALAELRRMLVVLRAGADPAHAPPQPGVADLPQLVENARVAGLDVTVQGNGDWPTLSPGLDLAVYRVVQEGLTNVTKHAAGSKVQVLLVGEHGHICVEVRDDGPGCSGGFSQGQGLIGMSQRVELYDGVLVVDGSEGFRVRATFPVERVGEPT